MSAGENGEVIALQQNCYDIIGDIEPVMREVIPEDVPYFVMGGMAAKPLTEAATEYESSRRVIIPADTPHISQFRDNGTKRDIDLLALTADQTILDAGKEALNDHIRGQLEVSVFGLKDHEQHTRSPKVRLLADFLSERTIDDQGVVRYVLGTIEQEVQPESLDPWQVALPNGVKLPVMHPLAQVLAYQTRSISGRRYKDRAKLAEMETNILPQFKNELEADGLFAEWQQFAATIEAMKLGVVGDTKVEQLVYQAKARGLAFVEKFERIVDFAQSERVQETILKPFVGKK